MADGEPVEPSLKKLKRLPHIFSQVLELPVAGDAAVESEETETAFEFVISGPQFVVFDKVKVEVVGIVPGAKKVILRGVQEQPVRVSDDLDTWRFRLPPSANPDATWAHYQDGVLTVIVPKVQSCKDDSLCAVKEESSAVSSAVKGACAITVF
ncbi:hypothetical protein SUGI_0643580 [Cryptomeria japonica]|uniref:17.9 kDa heat shock protein 2 n=1 Tax=Cryptomeria japonica TaxID=3369 RepID=UPI0024148F6D|nr:17.9 kDa heat shock protein 2 [Cryptomeria japonica]GLJ31972.1 hypothetical protein SUGI_0643580 [Cryptomeria japonica]